MKKVKKFLKWYYEQQVQMYATMFENGVTIHF